MRSQALVDRTKRHEGLLLKAKPDAKGKWVIGFGHDLSEAEAFRIGEITLAQAEQFLEDDLEAAWYACSKSLPWLDTLDELRREVIVEMAFQMGMGGLLGFRRLLMCLSAKDYAGAAAQGLMSQWHTQTPNRCEELMEILRTGVDTHE